MKLFGWTIERQHLATVVENESGFAVGSQMQYPRDRYDYDREKVLDEALEAWRTNPLARRIVELVSQYVVGGGLRVVVDDETTQKFVTEFWEHNLNQMPMRTYEWCDELTRSGELFLLVSTDAAGKSYVRAVPAASIQAIQTAANDVQQELAYSEVTADLDTRTWAGMSGLAERVEGGGFAPVMLHYAINRPVGAVRGESDLAPVLRWLSRYAGWLEDRARLNRFRNTFVFQVKAKFTSEAERLARQNALALTPPSPGSILVTDETEEWSVMAPQLQSSDANEDGLALKKMIAAGAGLPMHFLAEPEGSTRTTAEAAGGPAYRHFEQRQQFYCRMIADLLRVVVQRRALVGGGIKSDAVITVTGADLSARDNAALAVASSTVEAALSDLRDRGIIDDAELLRMVYRFAGETVDLEGLLADGKKAGPILPAAPQPPTGAVKDRKPGRKSPEIKLDPDGNPLGNAAI
jgi:hypothetical protein